MLTGVLKQVMSGVATFVLARLLAPAELGQVAAANSVVLVMSMIGSFGFNVSILRTPRDDRVTVSSVLALQLGTGVLGAVLALVAAGPLSDLVGLDDPALVRALAVVMVLQGVAGASRSLLLRDRRFRRVYEIDAGEAVVYLVAQIALAVAGWGAWAVITAQVASVALATLALARSSGWWFPTAVSRVAIRRVLSFGAAVFAGSTMTAVAKNADYWFVGGRLGAAALGVYYVAFVLPTILRQRVTWAASEALLPAIAASSAGGMVQRSRFLLSLRLHALVGFPMCVGLALVAADVVEVGFGEPFAGATAPMRIISLGTVAEFLLQASSTQLIGSGRSRPALVLGGVRLAVLAAGLALVAGAEGGLTAIAAAVVVSAAVPWVVSSAWVARVAGASVRDQLGAVAPAAVATAAMAGIVALAAAAASGLPTGARLAVVVPLGVAVYLPALALSGSAGMEQLRWLRATGRRAFGRGVPAAGAARP